MREDLQRKLIHSVRGNRPPHALILAGLDIEGAYRIAKATAAVYCMGTEDVTELTSCPDYQEVIGAALTVERARELITGLTMTSVHGKNRCILIRDAHQMSMLTQNTLLKVIEEPPDRTLLLFVGNEIGIIQTIRSRCMIFRIGGEDPEEIRRELMKQGKSADTAALCARVSDGILGDAIRFADPEYLEFRTSAVHLLEDVLFGILPFQKMRTLITVSGGADEMELDTEPSEDGNEEKRKKKKKPDSGKTQDLLNIWQSILRDALCKRIMEEGGFNPAGMIMNQDASELIQRISVGLPSRGIQSIIEMLLRAQEKLTGGAYPTMVLDALAADLSKREKV